MIRANAEINGRERGEARRKAAPGGAIGHTASSQELAVTHPERSWQEA
jgi:hypothetical protein